MPKDSVSVYPCACPEGHFLLGVAAVPQSVSRAEAERLVASGAFTYDPPPDVPAVPAESQET